MTEGEANRLSMCGYGCYVIGGPWITTNPACPECNNEDDELYTNGVRLSEEDE